MQLYSHLKNTFVRKQIVSSFQLLRRTIRYFHENAPRRSSFFYAELRIKSVTSQQIVSVHNTQTDYTEALKSFQRKWSF